MSRPDLPALLADAGWTLVRRNKHAVWRCPCGRHQTAVATSPGDYHGDQNCRAMIRRCQREDVPAWTR